MARSAPTRDRRWFALAAATWSGLFAVRGVYWALGGTLGLSTLSSGIREAHDAGDPYLFVALWITVALELVGVGLALSLVGTGARLPAWLPVLHGRTLPTWLPVLLAFAAGALLAGHGAFFASIGVRAAAGSFAVTSEVLWYSLFWGPWFMIGGVLFVLAAAAYLARSSEQGTQQRRHALMAAVLGTSGGLLTAAAPVVVSAIAPRA
jgi:hypothetical protein